MKKFKIVNHNFFMQKDIFRFELLTNVISGPNSINNLYKFLKEKKYEQSGLVVDDNLYKKSNYIRNFLKKFKRKKKLKKIIYFTGNSEPTYQYLDSVVNELKKKKNNKFDCLIAIGGGSTIDFAKGIATLLKNPGSSLRYMGFPKNLNQSIPIIAIPSTAGSGSELAYNAVFINETNKIKLGINTKNNYPKLSILDPKILANSPKNVILNSGLGALIRSLDSMFNKKANKVSKIFSENSFNLLFNSLSKTLKQRNDLENLSKMQWGAYFSIAALLNSSSGPAGVISYYLSTNYNIPQGLGYAIAGIYFFERNHNKGYHEYSKLFDLIKNKKINKKLSKKQKSQFIINSLIQILKNNKVTLKKYNIPFFEKQKILQLMFNPEFEMQFENPVNLNKKDLQIIIKKVLTN